MFIKDSKLEFIVSGKSVAIICPGKYLLGKGLGKIYDSCDVTMRVNDISPSFLQEDYGNNSHVIVHTFPTVSLSETYCKIQSNPGIMSQCSLLYCSTTKADHTYSRPIEENIKSVNIFNTPYSVITQENYQFLNDYFGCEPNTGMSAVLLALLHGAKEVLIGGITFYQEKEVNYQTVYYPGYNTFFQDGFSPRRGHNQPQQINIFVNKMLKEYPDKIKIDSHLKKLLNIEYHNVLQIGE